MMSQLLHKCGDLVITNKLASECDHAYGRFLSNANAQREKEREVQTVMLFIFF